jgi:hypothetical protein
MKTLLTRVFVRGKPVHEFDSARRDSTREPDGQDYSV